jgi:iron complex outermembrane receptor protein
MGVSSRALAQQAQSPAPAASPDTNSPALGDIIVTARKTSENVQKAPASIVAVSGRQISAAGITNPEDLEKFLPSANLGEEGPSVTQIFIRGVGNTVDLPNFSSGSAFLFNGIIIPDYGTTGMLFDLDSIQSIAGPQGTLYGGSAAGGAINVNSAQPRNDFSGSGLLDAGNYGAIHGSVSQNVPVGDSLSLRGAVDYVSHDAYVNNGIDAEDQVSGRLSARYDPSPVLDMLVFAAAMKSDGKPNTSLVVSPITSSNPWNIPSPPGLISNPFLGDNTYLNDQTYILGANVKLNVGGGTITYIPGFVWLSDLYHLYGPFGLFPVLHDREMQISQELRWERQFGALKLSGGGLYLHKTTDFTFALNYPTFAPFGTAISPPYFTPLIPNNTTNQVNETEAIFGQAVYSVTDDTRLTGGVRFSNDHIDVTGTDADGSFLLNRSQTSVDWKFGVDHDVTSRILVYANVQTGYIPFGYNPSEPSGSVLVGTPGNPITATVIPTARLLAYSGGVKSRFLDNRLEINDEVFYYDYTNFQATSEDAHTAKPIVASANATIYGNDLGIRANLTRDTELDFNYVYTHTEFTKFPAFPTYVGNQLILAPEHNIIAGLQHTLHLSLGDLVGRVSTHYNSGYFGDFSDAPATHQGAFTKTDLSLTFSPSGSAWNIEAYVRNVENSAVFGTLSVTSPTAANGDLEPPRTFGVQVSTRW